VSAFRRTAQSPAEAGHYRPIEENAIAQAGVQFMLQAPGPRGSPQDPHALIGRSQFPDDLAGVLDCAAKTDISF
jgi:hypothetical protein